MTAPTPVDLRGLVAAVEGTVGSVLGAMDWAEDEITQATARHPAAWDVLYHAHALLVPGDGMGVEWVYRSHARELLERAAAGRDTRPGTAAEVVLVCSRTSALAPFHTSAVGLFLRAWALAFPDRADVAGSVLDRQHYEALRADQIDDLEAETRRKLTVPNRRLTAVDCPGRHHGRPVTCRYGPAPLAIPAPRRAAQPSLLDLPAAG